MKSEAERFMLRVTAFLMFGREECRAVFGEGGDHLWEKFESLNRNPALFMNALDQHNVVKMFEWCDTWVDK